MQNFSGLILALVIIAFLIFVLIKTGGLKDIVFFNLSLGPSTSTVSRSKSGIELIDSSYQKNLVQDKNSKTENQPQNSDHSSSQNQNQSQSSVVNIKPLLGFTLEQLSPYYQKFSISGFYPNAYYRTLNFKIVASNNLDKPVKLTGWILKSNKGFLMKIPKGVPDYYPRFSLSEDFIYLDKGEYLNIYVSNSKPTGLANFNFRLNKCIGYLNNFFNIEPPFPNWCPSLFKKEDLINLSGKCQNFIRSLDNSCRQPTANEINSFAQEKECRFYLDQINYSTCYEKNHKSSDFFLKEWRVFLKNGSEFYYFNLDYLHDRLFLFDENGLLVAEYVY